jgi:Sulfotransferase family
MKKRFLFVAGCPRSGTSVLTRVLVAHPDIALGMERYNLRIAKRLLRPEDFDARRFFDIQPGDTWYKSFERLKLHYDKMRPKYEEAKYVGDKYPGAYEHYVSLVEHFPDVRFIFIVRNIFDVALSFEGRRARGDNWPADGGTEYAVARWNAAIGYTNRWRERAAILVIAYEDLFVRQGSAAPIADFLGIAPEPLEAALDRERRSKARDTGPLARLSPEQADYVCRYANFGGFRQLLGVAPQDKPAPPIRETAPLAAG